MLIDQDREARIRNALQRSVPASVADALKPLGQRPTREQTKEQAVFDRKLGDALQQHVAYGKVQAIQPPDQTQQITRRGPSLGR